MSSLDSRKPITLYRGFDHPGNYVWSPFVPKLELRLRLDAIPYVIKPGSPMSGPNGKIPYIDAAPLLNEDQQHLYGDSTLIPKELIKKGLMTDLNDGLSPRDAVLDLALRSLCEDKLYFFNLRERWLGSFYAHRDYVLWSFSWPLRVLIGHYAHGKVVANLSGQGTGRYTDAEFAVLRREAWDMLAEMLRDAKARCSPVAAEPFWALGGSQPTEADCTVYGFLISGLIADSATVTKDLIKGHPVLVDYVTRIHNKYFPDYKKPV